MAYLLLPTAYRGYQMHPAGIDGAGNPSDILSLFTTTPCTYVRTHDTLSRISMASSPSSPMSPPSCGKTRSRNAQAQAMLRSRRKVYVSNLEKTSEELTVQNEQLTSERDELRRQVNTLKSELRIFRESLTSRDGSGGVSADALLAALDAERAKVEKLREAIRFLSQVDADLEMQSSRSETMSDSACLSDIFPASSSSSSSSSSSVSSSSTATRVSTTTPTSTMDDAATVNYSIPTPASSLHPEETDSLSLLLAQPTTFKRQAARMLVTELLSSTNNTIYCAAPSPVVAHGQHHQYASSDQIDALLAHLFHDFEPVSSSSSSASISSLALCHHLPLFLNSKRTTGPRLNLPHLSPACMLFLFFLLVSSDRNIYIFYQCTFPSSARCSARTISRSHFVKVTRSHSPAPTRPSANALPIHSPLRPCDLLKAK